MIFTTDNKKYVLGKREPEKNSLNVVKIEERHLKSGSILRCELTESHMLFLITSGSICLSNRNIQKGNIVYISKFTNFKFTAVESASVIEIMFNYSDNNIQLFEESIRIFKASLEIKEYINRMYYNKFYINSLAGVSEALMLNVLNMLNILCNSHSLELGLYQKFCEWTEQNPACYITPESAAAAMGCSVAHLNRTVKKYSSKCLSTVISEKRILEIKMLSKYSSCSTKDIACKLGFGSPELLRKFFKYHTGISLKEYRAKLI